MHQNLPVATIVLPALLTLPVSAAASSPASELVSQPTARPAANRAVASRPVAQAFKQGQAVETPEWTITVLSSSCTLGKRIGNLLRLNHQRAGTGE